MTSCAFASLLQQGTPKVNKVASAQNNGCKHPEIHTMPRQWEPNGSPSGYLRRKNGTRPVSTNGRGHPRMSPPRSGCGAIVVATVCLLTISATVNWPRRPLTAHRRVGDPVASLSPPFPGFIDCARPVGCTRRPKQSATASWGFRRMPAHRVHPPCAPCNIIGVSLAFCRC